jgi:hypothetical protein
MFEVCCNKTSNLEQAPQIFRKCRHYGLFGPADYFIAIAALAGPVNGIREVLLKPAS